MAKTSKPKNKVEEIAGKAKDMFFGKEKEEKTPGKIVEGNRAKGSVIAAELAAVDFLHSKIEDTKTDEEQPVGDLQIWRDYVVKEIKNAPTIFDEISGIDNYLLYAAQAFRTAIADGSENKAIWARNALSAGILYLRDNIPADQEERKEAILKEREKYLKKYKNVILLYEKIDNLQREIDTYTADIKEKREEYTPIKEEVLRLLDTEEGKKQYGNITLNQNQPGKLSEAEKELMKRLRYGASLAHTILRQEALRNASEITKVAEMQRANDYRIDLVHKPMVYNEQLVAEHGALLEEQDRRIAKDYVEAAELIKITREADARLQAILNGKAAQDVAADTVGWVNRVLDEEIQDNGESYMEGLRKAKEMAEQKITNAKKREEIDKLMEKSESELQNLNAEVQAVQNTAKVMNMGKNKQVNMNYSS